MEDKKILENEKLDKEQLDNVAGGNVNGSYHPENNGNTIPVKKPNVFGNDKPEIPHGGSF